MYEIFLGATPAVQAGDDSNHDDGDDERIFQGLKKIKHQIQVFELRIKETHRQDRESDREQSRRCHRSKGEKKVELEKKISRRVCRKVMKEEPWGSFPLC